MSAISRRARRVVVASLAFAALSTASARAKADDRAEDLFVRGRDAMLRGDLATGCPLLDESQNRDPRLGVLFTLAECEAQWGKASRAYTHYDAFLRDYAKGDAVHTEANDERQRIATSRQRTLARKLALVTLTLPAPSPGGAKQLLKVNGHDVQDDLLARELPLDPGEAVFELTSGAAAPQRVRVVVAAGERRTVTFTTASATVSANVASPTASPVAVAPLASAPITPSAAPSSRRPWAYVAGATALTGLGVGAVAGAMVLGKKKAIDDHCIGRRCDAEGLAEVDRARTLGTVSSVAFAVGAAAAVTTVVLVIVRPSHRAVVGAGGAVSFALRASPADASALVFGTW